LMIIVPQSDRDSRDAGSALRTSVVEVLRSPRTSILSCWARGVRCATTRTTRLSPSRLGTRACSACRPHRQRPPTRFCDRHPTRSSCEVAKAIDETCLSRVPSITLDVFPTPGLLPSWRGGSRTFSWAACERLPFGVSHDRVD
jgi:hypothetical protein